MGGALLSLEIAVLAFFGGMVIGTAGAAAVTLGSPALRRIARAYIVFFTNTPQLVQIFFLFFVLPDAGIVLDPLQAVLLGMTLNAGAYLTEIQRAGFTSVRQTELDAAAVLGMSTWQSIRYVILPHVVRTLFAPLSNHFILMVLGTSMAAVFGVDELTGRAYSINAETFRSLEVFSVTAILYVLITIAASMVLALAGRALFRVRMKFV
ncbi:MAG: amino acid ABC transporter permease [Proteobacteria bacterium]|nr:amino acid ABC transporter permease [Pseudomonadota bacterium]